MISGDSAGYIAAWDNQTRKCIRLLYDSESENLRGMVLMPDGRRIVSASRGLNVWDLVTRDLLHSFEFRYDVNCIAAHPDGHSVVVGFDDCTTVWNLSTHLKTHEISAGAKSLAVLPNGRVILVHPGEDGVSLGNLNSGSILSQLDLFDAPVTSVAIVPDGRRAVFGMKDGQVSICDLHCGVVLHTFPRGNGYHTEAAT